jgi:hypothetical protein
MGDIMETLDKAEKMLCKGIDEIGQKGELNASSLELLGNATDALKDIYSIKEKMEGGSYERYMPMYMDDGYSRGRMRDSRGRYMNDGYMRDGYNRYDAGYSNYRADSYGHTDEEEKEFLRYKMQNAKNEQEREMYRRKLEQM